MFPQQQRYENETSLRRRMPGGITAWCSLFLNQSVFQENKIFNFKIHLFSILNTKNTNSGIFSNKTLIWKNFLKCESPILTLFFYHSFDVK